jgi:signal transduction histidine kinase
MSEKKTRTPQPGLVRGNKGDSNAKQVVAQEDGAALIREERRRIARLLHDGLQQELTLAVLLADTLVARRSQDGTDVALEVRLLEQLKRLNVSARTAIESLLPQSEMIDELLRSSAKALQDDTVNGERVKRD